MIRYSAVIPAYNEERLIKGAVLATSDVFSAFGEPFEVIVVDDGSTDSTSSVVEAVRQSRPDVRLVRHKTNLGKGAAVRSGMLAAQGEWALFLDADHATHPSTFAGFIPKLSSSDIVFGSRRVPGARIVTAQPWHRDLSGQAFNTVVRAITGLPHRDTQCGFKAFRMNVCRPLFESLSTRGWAFDVELLVRARQAGLSVKELPVDWRHGPVSRVRFSHFPRILGELWRIRHSLDT